MSKPSSEQSESSKEKPSKTQDALSNSNPISSSSNRLSSQNAVPAPYFEVNKFLVRFGTEIPALASSITSTYTTYPFDTLKSRIQAHREISLVEHLRRIHQEGGVRVIFRGVTIPLVSTSAVRTISMSVYTGSRKIYADAVKRNFGYDVIKSLDTVGAYPCFTSAAVIGAAGMTAGGSVSLFACPFELGKISAQTSGLMTLTKQQSSVTDPTGSSSFASGPGKGSFGAMKNLYFKRGINGLYIGYKLHFLRDSFGTGVYFTIYESTKQLLHTWRGHRYDSDNALAGGLCGIFGLAFIYPIDTAKTAFQHEALSKPWKDVKPAEIIWLKADVYKGFWVASVRSALTNAIFFSTYEFLKKRISRIKEDNQL